MGTTTCWDGWCERGCRLDWIEIGQRSGVGILTRLLEREIGFLKYVVVVGEVVWKKGLSVCLVGRSSMYPYCSRGGDPAWEGGGEHVGRYNRQEMPLESCTFNMTIEMDVNDQFRAIVWFVLGIHREAMVPSWSGRPPQDNLRTISQQSGNEVQYERRRTYLFDDGVPDRRWINVLNVYSSRGVRRRYFGFCLGIIW